jgi:hypothetical protein
MDDTLNEEVIELEEPIIDATTLIVDETIVEDESYEELIILDLRRADRHDAWLC